MISKKKGCRRNQLSKRDKSIPLSFSNTGIMVEVLDNKIVFHAMKVVECSKQKYVFPC